MATNDLVENIRADFVTGVMPFFQVAPTSATAAQFLTMYLRSSDVLLSKAMLCTCATIIERNAIEYCLTSRFKQEPTFQNRLLVRFASASVARALTEVIFKGNRGLWGFLVRPAIAGSMEAIALMLDNPSATRDWIESKRPGTVDLVRQELHLDAIMSLIQLLTSRHPPTNPPID
jgi:hypothetical protein